MSKKQDWGRVLIIGAGPTALGAACRFRELGFDDFGILEASESPGGLASSFVDSEGFTWDIGGHVHFSHYSTYDRVLDEALGDQWLTHERSANIWIEGRFVPYPLQLNLHHLPKELAEKALADLERVSGEKLGRSAHFEEWILEHFGETLARIFLFPYNLKVWGYPLFRLGSNWVGERVALPNTRDLRQAKRSGEEETSWGPNRTFRFPRKGGTGAIWSAVATKLVGLEKFEFGASVIAVDSDARSLTLQDGRKFSFDTLITTIPVDQFVSRTAGLPNVVVTSASSLLHSSVYVVGIGLRGRPPSRLRSAAWMYFPDPETPYYRVTVFSNYSPNHVPAPDCWSLMAEVCDTPYLPVVAEDLVSRVISAMRQDRLITDESQIVSQWLRREEYGYPTPSVDRDQLLDGVLPVLEDRGIFSRGRFGAWKYEVSNQDHSFMQGWELAGRLLGRGEEVTLQNPSLVNSGYNC